MEQKTDIISKDHMQETKGFQLTQVTSTCDTKDIAPVIGTSKVNQSFDDKNKSATDLKSVIKSEHLKAKKPSPIWKQNVTILQRSKKSLIEL